MEDEHLDTILVTESANTIKSSVDDLDPTPSESADLSDGESECDVPINDDSLEYHFTTFSNPLFYFNDDFSSDDESLSEEEIQKDEFKYFSNPLYDLDDEIFTNEKFLLIKKDFGIENDEYDSEGDIRFLEELLSSDSPPLPENESFSFDHFDDPSLPRPPLEPPDVEICFNFEPDAGDFINKVVGDISEHDVLMPNLLPTQPTLCPVFHLLLPFSSENEDKLFKPASSLTLDFRTAVPRVFEFMLHVKVVETYDKKVQMMDLLFHYVEGMEFEEMVDELVGCQEW
ncbi:hypothetical protein Tco_1185672 [Tanacetum coccineum]